MCSVINSSVLPLTKHYAGKRLFRIWLCMPLRNVEDINARLDAVQDLLDHPTFEQQFTSVAKGLPDLERIVSRIHARNCKVKDFLKVLTVSYHMRIAWFAAHLRSFCIGVQESQQRAIRVG